MKYFSTFSGIGGFELGMPEHFECVGFSEIDKYASAIYQYQFPNHKNYGDITTINESELPDFGLFVGGFPCQAFSIAGHRRGFQDTRGTLFFDVARILSAKRPRWFVLENVKGLLSHERGETLATIYEVLTDLGYTVGWEVVNSCHFGVAQNRERIYLVGCLRAEGVREVLPLRKNDEVFDEKGCSAERQPQAKLCTTVRAGMGGKADGTYVVDIVGHSGTGGQRGDIHNPNGIMTCLSATDYKQPKQIDVGTIRTHKDGNGFRESKSGLCPTIPARAREDGSGQPAIKRNMRYRRITPTECERLQGFPDGWTETGNFDGVEKAISDTQRYKTLGNAVTVNVTKAILNKIYKVEL